MRDLKQKIVKTLTVGPQNFDKLQCHLPGNTRTDLRAAPDELTRLGFIGLGKTGQDWNWQLATAPESKNKRRRHKASGTRSGRY